LVKLEHFGRFGIIREIGLELGGFYMGEIGAFWGGFIWVKLEHFGVVLWVQLEHFGAILGVLVVNGCPSPKK
jgi:hypothetical protein